MTAFRIEIPEQNILIYDEFVFEIADGLARIWATRNGGKILFEHNNERLSVILSGEGVPGESIAFFAAIAQSDPLHLIIQHLEELLSDETLLR